jgi:hypothetical protein
MRDLRGLPEAARAGLINLESYSMALGRPMGKELSGMLSTWVWIFESKAWLGERRYGTALPGL